ncbi:hypothetical protein FH972_021218 [Carpinus fangiana]|uniref:DNA (cytosine-5-)-methyltransferase n=1 Tax=Carpinus fangiana TaxID=176857 RepID=A0A5N6KNS0_9ROSI|nr:hypothetical protein FH972_021218 [Carpinus fangiana]
MTRSLPHRSRVVVGTEDNDDSFITISDDLPVRRETQNQARRANDSDEEAHFEENLSAPDLGPTDLHLDSAGGSLNLPWAETERINYRGTVYKRGDCVELKHPKPNKPRQGDFLQVYQIAENLTTNQVVLSGLLLRRNNATRGMLDPKLNELHLCLQIVGEIPNNPSAIFERGLVQVYIHEVVTKRKVIFTNHPAASATHRARDWSFREHAALHTRMHNYDEQKHRIFREEVLVCRWVFILRFINAEHKRSQKCHESELRRLSEKELRDGRVTATFLHQCKPTADIDLYLAFRGKDDPESDNYSFVDGFCGCGGTSEAAASVGYKIRCGFDHDETAVRAFQSNRNDSTDAIHCSSFEFIALAKHYAADVMHLSPPCQYFSPAHTREGQNDEQNTATLLSVGKLVDAGRPRVVTLEQTSGIINRHPQWFNALTNQFTTQNFGIRWRNIDFRDYGLAQRRSRLVILASCPGTCPPPFANQTHGQAPSLLPWNNIANVLATIPRSASHQGPAYSRGISMPSYNPTQRQAVCITRDGGQPTHNYHPSGLRTFNVRELAALQGFRHDFILPAVKAKHVIGNAVPPSAFAPFLRSVKTYLHKQDTWIVRETGRVHVIDD